MIPATAVPFHPYLTAPSLRAPTLMMVGRNDEMVHCNPAAQRAVFDKIVAYREFFKIDGGTSDCCGTPESYSTRPPDIRPPS